MKLLRWLFYLFLFVFPFGQLLRIDLSARIPGVRIQPIDLSIFLLVTLWILRKIAKQEKIIFPPLAKEIIIFGLIAFCSLLFQLGKLKAEEFITSFLYLCRLLNIIVFFLVATELFTKERLPVLTYLLAEGVIVAVLSFIQYLFMPDTRFLFELGWDKHYFRAIGPFLDPGFNGIILALAFLIWIVCSCEYYRKKRYFLLLVGLILLVAVGLTFSRITYLSLGLGLLTMFLINKKKRIYLWTVLVLFIVIFFAPKPGGEGVNLRRKSSFIARKDAYEFSLKIIRKNFFFGVGYNAYRYSQRNYGFISETDWQTTNAGAGTDNSFLFVLATTGFLGFLSFSYFWAKSLYLAFTNSRKNHNAFVLFASLIVVSVSAFAINSLFYPWVFSWLMVLFANFMAGSTKSILTQSCFGLGRHR